MEPAWTAARRDEAEAWAEHPCHAGNSPGTRGRRVSPKPGSRPLPETARRSRRFGRQREERRGHHAARLRVRSVPEGTADCPSQLSYPTPAPRRGARPIIVARRWRVAEIHRGRPARDGAPSALDCTSRTRRTGCGALARVPDRKRVEAAETRRPEPPRLDREAGRSVAVDAPARVADGVPPLLGRLRLGVWQRRPICR